ncbi:hypothetical protein KFE25_006676 [Diacronema lutheri]|uniref:Chorein N-terminal domain-containing protein n=1 Tax=Diacronema lutheri TaxID=2081491 RepID=A0A8J5XPG1_DIALT|nr:hypothetical protein KFE25_006676 [Diacronema lutheri]
MWSRAERLIADLLAKYLGAYIRDFAHQRLKVGVWSGHLQLEAFEITPDALEMLGLPLVVARSRIGRLSLHVPWSRLLSEPVRLVVEDIDIELRPKTRAELDGRQHERRERMRKRMRLDYAELVRYGVDGSGMRQPGGGSSAAGGSADASLLSHLSARLLGNARLTLKNVHVRYTHAGPAPFRCGLQLGELTVCAANARWEPAVVPSATAGSAQPERRLLELDGLEAYCADQRSGASDAAGGCALLHPLSVRALLCLATQPRPPCFAPESERAGAERAPAGERGERDAARDGDGDREGEDDDDRERDDEAPTAGEAGVGEASAWTCAQLRIDEVRLSLSSRQSAQLARLRVALAHLVLLERYGRFRPAASVRDDARGWWVYAARAVLSDRERHRRRYDTWTALARRRAVRQEYVTLWVRHLHAAQRADALPALFRARLAELEDELQLEDVLFFRALAEHTWRRAAAAAARTADVRALDEPIAGWLGLRRLLGDRPAAAEAAFAQVPPARLRSSSAGALDMLPARSAASFEPTDAALPHDLVHFGTRGAPPPAALAQLSARSAARDAPAPGSPPYSVSESDGEGAQFEDALDTLAELPARRGNASAPAAAPRARALPRTGNTPFGCARVTEGERAELRSALDGHVSAAQPPPQLGARERGETGVRDATGRASASGPAAVRRAAIVASRTLIDVSVRALSLALLRADSAGGGATQLAELACAELRALHRGCTDGPSHVRLSVRAINLRDPLCPHPGASHLVQARERGSSDQREARAPALRLVSTSAPAPRAALDEPADVATRARIEVAPLRLLLHVHPWARLAAAFSTAGPAGDADEGADGEHIVQLDDEVRASNALPSPGARARAKLELLLRPELRQSASVVVLVRAPLLVLPADAGSEASAWLGIEMDALTLTSVPRALDRRELDALAGAGGGETDGAAYRQLLLDTVYAQSEVAASNVQVVVHRAQDAAPRGTRQQARAAQEGERIVRPFGARVLLETCALPADRTLARTRAAIDVRRLDIELSARALAAVASIARSLNDAAVGLAGGSDEPGGCGVLADGARLEVQQSPSATSSPRCVSSCFSRTSAGGGAAPRPPDARHNASGDGREPPTTPQHGAALPTGAADWLRDAVPAPPSAMAEDGMCEQLLVQGHFALASAGLRIVDSSGAPLMAADLLGLSAHVQQRTVDGDVVLQLQHLKCSHGPLTDHAALSIAPSGPARHADAPESARASPAAAALHLELRVSERACSADVLAGTIWFKLDPTALATVLLKLGVGDGAVERGVGREGLLPMAPSARGAVTAAGAALVAPPASPISAAARQNAPSFRVRMTVDELGAELLDNGVPSARAVAERAALFALTVEGGAALESAAVHIGAATFSVALPSAAPHIGRVGRVAAAAFVEWRVVQLLPATAHDVSDQEQAAAEVEGTCAIEARCCSGTNGRNTARLLAGIVLLDVHPQAIEVLTGWVATAAAALRQCDVIVRVAETSTAQEQDASLVRSFDVTLKVEETRMALHAGIDSCANASLALVLARPTLAMASFAAGAVAPQMARVDVPSLEVIVGAGALFGEHFICPTTLVGTLAEGTMPCGDALALYFDAQLQLGQTKVRITPVLAMVLSGLHSSYARFFAAPAQRQLSAEEELSAQQGERCASLRATVSWAGADVSVILAGVDGDSRAAWCAAKASIAGTRANLSWSAAAQPSFIARSDGEVMFELSMDKLAITHGSGVMGPPFHSVLDVWPSDLQTPAISLFVLAAGDIVSVHVRLGFVAVACAIEQAHRTVLALFDAFRPAFEQTSEPFVSPSLQLLDEPPRFSAFAFDTRAREVRVFLASSAENDDPEDVQYIEFVFTGNAAGSVKAHADERLANATCKLDLLDIALHKRPTRFSPLHEQLCSMPRKFLAAPANFTGEVSLAYLLFGAVDVATADLQCDEVVLHLSTDGIAALGDLAQLVGLALAQIDLSWLPARAVNASASETVSFVLRSLNVLLVDDASEPAFPRARIALVPVRVRVREAFDADRMDCILNASLSADVYGHVCKRAEDGLERVRWSALSLFAHWPITAHLAAGAARIHANELIALTLSADMVAACGGPARALGGLARDLSSGDVLINKTGDAVHAWFTGCAPVLVPDGASASLAQHVDARGNASPLDDMVDVLMPGYSPIRVSLALGSSVLAITRCGGVLDAGAEQAAAERGLRDTLFARCTANPGGRTLLLASAVRLINLTDLPLDLSVTSAHFSDQVEHAYTLAKSVSYALPPRFCLGSNRMHIAVSRMQPQSTTLTGISALLSLDPRILNKLAAQPASEVICGDHTFSITLRCEIAVHPERCSWTVLVEAPLVVTNLMPCTVALHIGASFSGACDGVLLASFESVRISKSVALAQRAIVALSTDLDAAQLVPVALLSSARSTPLEALSIERGAGARASQLSRGQPSLLTSSNDATLGVQEEASTSISFQLPSGTGYPSMPMIAAAEHSPTGSLHLRLTAKLCVLNHTGLALEYLCEDEVGTSPVPVSGLASAHIFQAAPWAGFPELLRSAADARWPWPRSNGPPNTARGLSVKLSRDRFERLQPLRVSVTQGRLLVAWRLRGCSTKWTRLSMPFRAHSNATFVLEAEDGKLHSFGAALRHIEGAPAETLTLLLSPRVVVLNSTQLALRLVRAGAASRKLSKASAWAASASASSLLLPACTPGGRAQWLPMNCSPISSQSSIVCKLEGVGANARMNVVSGLFELVVEDKPAQPRHCTLRMREAPTEEWRASDPANALLVAMTSFALTCFATTAVVFSTQQSGAAPFQICNNSPHELRFRQQLRASLLGDMARWERLSPFAVIEYAWDEPLARPRLLEISRALADDAHTLEPMVEETSSGAPRRASNVLAIVASALLPSRAHTAPGSVSYALDRPGAVAHALPVASGASLLAELRSVGAVRCLHLTVAPTSAWTLSRRLLGHSLPDVSRLASIGSGGGSLRSLLPSPARSPWSARSPLNTSNARWEVLVSASGMHAHVLGAMTGGPAPNVGVPGVAGTRAGHLPRALEIVSAYLGGVTLSWAARQGGVEDIEVNVRHAQVDCELVPCTHPVILRRSHAGPDPLVHVRVRLVRPATAMIGALNAPIVIEEASIRAQQLELCLELQVLSALAHLGDGLLLENLASCDASAISLHLGVGRRGVATPNLLVELERLRRSGMIDGAVYVENLTVHSLRINLTVQLDLNPRRDSLDAPVRRWLIGASGKSGAGQQRAPLRLPAMRVVNSLQRPQTLVDALARHVGRGLSDELLFKLAIGTLRVQLRPV